MACLKTIVRPLGSMPALLPRRSLLLGAFLVASTGLRAAEVPNYETQIRPILKEHCTHCHGEEEKPKGGVDLRLRRFMDGKTEDGDPVLTPGDPEKSALWTLTRDGEMPKKGKKMPEHQLALLAVAVRAVLLEDRADLRLVVRAFGRVQARRADEERGQ